MKSVHDKIRDAIREKTLHSPDELDRMAAARYAEIKTDLEASHHGDFVMIEVDSGEYFLGKSPDEALREAQHAHPNKAFCLYRIGHRAAAKMRGT